MDASYCARTSEQILAQLHTNLQGLPQEEAIHRFHLYGPNMLVVKQHSWVWMFLAKFLNPLILLLIAASAISALLKETANFLIITVMVFTSVIVDFYQQYQAEHAAEILKKRVSVTATVIREGKKEEIPIIHLVPGDIITLAAGDIIPADSRLIESNILLVDQSALTGESFPQLKQAEYILKIDTSLNEQTNMIFTGTHVVSGEAIAVVVRTGMNTEFGTLAKHLTQKRPETEFAKGLTRFSFFLMNITLILVVIVFFTNTIMHHNIITSFLFALALAVGLTPELLPMVLTINLSRGATRMSKKGVIVKDLPAIQNFGSMQILCTDKTGTLTENHIILERYEDIHAQENHEVLMYGYLSSTFQGGLRNPMEDAVLAHTEVNVRGYKKIDEIPFDFVRKRLSVVLYHKDGYILVTKGEPENLIKQASHYTIGDHLHVLTPQIRTQITQRCKELGEQGFRVLAVAMKKVQKKKNYVVEDEQECTFVGLMAFFDPPKQTAKEALYILQQQGTHVKILTGDNEFVTKRVCEELELPVEKIMVGSTVKSMSDSELEKYVTQTTIFARLTPTDKERIILALKKNGNVVGYLGDGINDATSLRAADVGISVDNAVDIAKESADVILLKKDLHVLRDGVYEGRKTFGNVMKYIMMGTSSNFGNMFSVALASFVLPFLPMLPVQIILNNFLYDISQLTIPSDNVDPEYIEKPRTWDIQFIKRFMLVFGPMSSAFDLVTFAVLLGLFRATPQMFQTGWFVESLVTQSLIIFSIRTWVVPFFKRKASRTLVASALGIAGLGMLLPFSSIGRFFSLEPLPSSFFVFLIGATALYFLCVEIVKMWFYKKYAV